MIIEEQGNLDRLRDAIKKKDLDAAKAAAKAFCDDAKRNIVECSRCGQRNRVAIKTAEELERAISHAVCGACKRPLLDLPCICGKCK